MGTNANWSRSDGAGVDGAGVDGAGLDGAGLEAAGLDGAGLDGAGLDGAGLEGAGLDGASVGEADPLGAGVPGAELLGAGAEEVGAAVGGAGVFTGGVGVGVVGAVPFAHPVTLSFDALSAPGPLAKPFAVRHLTVEELIRVPVIPTGIWMATAFPEVTRVCSIRTLFARIKIDPLMLLRVMRVPALRTINVPV
jgi:hypothetical protein